MSEPIWNKFLTERDKAVFGTSGYGARQGFGKRPALLIIDVNYAFCDERPMPILESIKRWRNSCGEDAWVAMPYLKQLIEKAHGKGIPVIYTTGVRRDDNWDSGSWSWKNNRSDEDTASRPATNIDGNEIVAEIDDSYEADLRLVPDASGLEATIWIAPVAAAIMAAALLVFVFRRWRGEGSLVPTDAERALVEEELRKSES